MQLVAKSLAPSKSARGSSESFLGVRAETAHLEIGRGLVNALIIEHPNIVIGLVYGKIYRQPWISPLNMGLSCKFSLKPIQ
jgi:hypothetical protein